MVADLSKGREEGIKKTSSRASEERSEQPGRADQTTGDGKHTFKSIGYRARGRIARGARYRAIYRYQRQFGVKETCACLGVSRSAYYAWVKRMGQPDPDQERMKIVLEAYDRSRRIYGYRRIQLWIAKEYGININHKAVLRLMRKLNIFSVARQRNPYRLINNRNGAIHTYPNLLRQDFSSDGPNQKWGTDITYIRTQQGFVYLAIIKDFFDGTILGHALSRNNSIQIVLQAVRTAASDLRSPTGVIIQSDRGAQYQSSAYRTLTAQYGIIPSMSRAGHCLDNAPTESFFSHLKEEVVRHIKIKDFREAVQVVDDYIHFYNHDRIQLKTKLTPLELRRQFQ